MLLDAVPVAQLIDVTMADRCQPQRTSSKEGLRDMGRAHPQWSHLRWFFLKGWSRERQSQGGILDILAVPAPQK